jgi:calcineurin-like phosphoesterase family protein
VNPDKLFFTSDTHFGNGAVIGFGRRPFGSREEMDAELIREWNKAVPSDGVVFHLGDVSFHGTDTSARILNELNGTIHLIEGNHDRGATKKVRSRFASINQYQELKIEGHRIVLCHFPIESWNQIHYGSWHLHGHTHGSLPGFGRRLDVGMDALRFWYPISYRAIEARMKTIQPASRDFHQFKGTWDNLKD